MALHKILKIVALLLGVAGVIFLAMIIAKGDEAVSASGSKWVGTGLYAFYILAILAVGSMVFSGIKKVTK